MIAVAVSSEENLKHSTKIAPDWESSRSPHQARRRRSRRLVAQSTPVYYITGTIPLS